MKIINKSESLGPKIDWSRPVVHFDPWPFAGPSVKIKLGRYLRSDGTWSDLVSEWVLHSSAENVLGYTTDGHPFVARAETLDKLA